MNKEAYAGDAISLDMALREIENLKRVIAKTKMLVQPVWRVKDTTFDCPQCKSKSIQTIQYLDKYTFGDDDDYVQLEVEIPIRHCDDCTFEYTDDQAEDIRHLAVYKHISKENSLLKEKLQATQNALSAANMRLAGIYALANEEVCAEEDTSDDEEVISEYDIHEVRNVYSTLIRIQQAVDRMEGAQARLGVDVDRLKFHLHDYPEKQQQRDQALFASIAGLFAKQQFEAMSRAEGFVNMEKPEDE